MVLIILTKKHMLKFLGGIYNQKKYIYRINMLLTMVHLEIRLGSNVGSRPFSMQL